MVGQTASSAVDLDEEVFDLLKRRGPLCASQIAVTLGVSPRKVTSALEKLAAEGLIELRPDHDPSFPPDNEFETPWGLVRPSWLQKLKSH